MIRGSSVTGVAPRTATPNRARVRVGPVLLLGVLLSVVMIVWSLATARYGGPDEPAHVLRANSVAAGDLIGRPVATLAPGYRSVLVPAPLATGDPSCYRHDEDVAATCGVEDPTATGSIRAASSAGTYPPLYYALVGVPVRVIGDVADVAWYRLVAAFWCALVLTAAAVRARRFGPALWIVAITPAAWFLVGVVNPNALEISLAVLAWVGVERIRTGDRRTRRSDVVWIAAPMALAIAIRPVAAMAWIAMTGAVWIGDRDREVTNRLDRRDRLWWCAPPIAAIAASIGWTAWASVAVDDSRTAERLPLLDSLWRSVDESTETWREMAGSLGWLEFSAPWVAHVVWWAIVAVAAWVALTTERGLRRAWTWLLVAMVAGPIAFEVFFASSVGFIWQGRYSIPTGVGLVILGMGSWRARLAPWLGSTVVTVAAVAQVVTLWAVLQRYTVGANGSWWFRDATWRPAVAPLLLLAVDAAVMAAMIAASRRAFGDVSVSAFRDFAPDDVERRPGAEPLDLLGAERVDTLEVDR